MRGIERLIAVRSTGKRPTLAWIWVGAEYAKFFLEPGRELQIDAPSVSADLRPLVGLDVIVMVEACSPALWAMWERLQSYARSATLHINDWRDAASVIVWDRKHGQRSLEDCCNG